MLDIDRAQLLRMALTLVELSQAGVRAQLAMLRVNRVMRYTRAPRGPATPRVDLPHQTVRLPR